MALSIPALFDVIIVFQWMEASLAAVTMTAVHLQTCAPWARATATATAIVPETWSAATTTAAPSRS